MAEKDRTARQSVLFCREHRRIFETMPTRLISAISLVLLTVFIFNVCIFGVMLSAQLALHQQEQLEKIRNKKKKAIIELRIQRHLVEERNSNFQWVKDWEFRWLGEMYDIEDSYLDGNTWVFHVKHDTKEDMLRKQIERHAQDENKKREAQAKKNLKCGEYFEDFTLRLVNDAQCSIRLPEWQASLALPHRSPPYSPPKAG
jgi:hypothetical protein